MWIWTSVLPVVNVRKNVRANALILLTKAWLSEKLSMWIIPRPFR